MRRLLLLLVVVPAVLTAGSNPHFDLLATFEASQAPGKTAASWSRSAPSTRTCA